MCMGFKYGEAYTLQYFKYISPQAIYLWAYIFKILSFILLSGFSPGW